MVTLHYRYCDYTYEWLNFVCLWLSFIPWLLSKFQNPGCITTHHLSVVATFNYCISFAASGFVCILRALFQFSLMNVRVSRFRSAVLFLLRFFITNKNCNLFNGYSQNIKTDIVFPFSFFKICTLRLLYSIDFVWHVLILLSNFLLYYFEHNDIGLQLLYYWDHVETVTDLFT